MEKPKFRKITGDKDKSTATPVNDEQLEEAIREKSIPIKDSVDASLTSEQKKIDALPVNFEVPPLDKDISPESKETLQKIATGEYSVPDSLLTETQKSTPVDLDYNSELKKLTKDHEDLEKELEKRVAKRPSIQHVIALRRRDRHFNKTCAACGERKLLSEMDGGKAEICDTCK